MYKVGDRVRITNIDAVESYYADDGIEVFMPSIRKFYKENGYVVIKEVRSHGMIYVIHAPGIEYSSQYCYPRYMIPYGIQQEKVEI